MSPERTALLKGALKSAVGGASGVLLAVIILDPIKFDVRTAAGWLNIAGAMLIAVATAEARYWKQWADSGNNHAPPSPPANIAR